MGRETARRLRTGLFEHIHQVQPEGELTALVAAVEQVQDARVMAVGFDQITQAGGRVLPAGVQSAHMSSAQPMCVSASLHW